MNGNPAFYLARSKYILALKDCNLTDDIRNAYISESSDLGDTVKYLIVGDILSTITKSVISKKVSADNAFTEISNELSAFGISFIDLEVDGQNIMTLLNYCESIDIYYGKYVKFPSILESSDESLFRMCYSIYLLRSMSNVNITPEIRPTLDSIIEYLDRTEIKEKINSFDINMIYKIDEMISIADYKEKS